MKLGFDGLSWCGCGCGWFTLEKVFKVGVKRDDWWDSWVKFGEFGVMKVCEEWWLWWWSFMII